MNALLKLYWSYRISRIAFLGDRKPFACSLAPTLACNLACAHCYTASPRARAEVQHELTLDAFRKFCLMLRKRGIRHATLTDGEPLLTELSQEKCKVATEIFDQTWIVTNGTHGFPEFKNTLYVVSLDGEEETHDRIRGKGVFEKIKENISLFQPYCYCNTTLTKVNHGKIKRTVEAAIQLGTRGICFAWTTPMSPKDILHLPHEERQKDIDEILKLKKLYGNYILNSEEELNLMRTNEWSKRCPNWFVESYDAYGNRKSTCVFGEATSFMCGNCGCNIYTSILTMIEQLKPTLISKLAFSVK